MAFDNTPNSDALKSRQGPTRQPRINGDGPGGDGYYQDGGSKTTLINGFFAANPGQVPNDPNNAYSLDQQDQVSYSSPYKDWSTVGHGVKPQFKPPIPIMAMHVHPEFDGEKLDAENLTKGHVGLGQGVAPGAAQLTRVPQQATFGMKGDKPRNSPYGTKFGLGPMGSGPQRNVKRA